MVRKKFHALINVAGLAIGITLCLIILLFVRYELSYDKFHAKADQIYRIIGEFSFGGEAGAFALSPGVMGPTIKEQFPEVKQYCRFRTTGSMIFTYNDISYKEEDVTYVDSTFFEMFSFKLLQGNPATCLDRAGQAVISASLANKIFGNTNPVGKVLSTSDEEELVISGVVEDMPQNSHIKFDVLMAMSGLPESSEVVWLSNNYFTYLLMDKNLDEDAFEEKLEVFQRQKLAPYIKQHFGMPISAWNAEGNFMRASLQPMEKVHLYSDFDLEITNDRGDIKYILIFSAIALFVLIIACVNFMNLSTAKSEHRAREVGVRKVLGAERRHIIAQFLAEAIVLSTLALFVSLVLLELLLPYFNDFTGKSLHITDIGVLGLVPLLLLLPFAVGLFAGSYPAFYLSSFQPITIIRGRLSGGRSSAITRNVLVVIQFTLSFIMVVGTIVIYQQLQLLQNKDLGYEKDNLLVLHDAYQLGERAQAFRQEMVRHPAIINGTITSYLTAGNSVFNNTMVFKDGNPADPTSTPCQKFYVDDHFISTYGMTILEGRDFSTDLADSNAIIINQKAVAQFGFDNPIGKQLGMFTNSQGDIKIYTIIGVVKDFHYRDLKLAINPLVMIQGKSSNNILFRIKEGKTEEAIAMLASAWNTFTHGRPFEYSFITERLATSLSAERRLSTLFVIFCGLAIFIAALGLFGLASYIIEQRTKEIGIRKILGAEVHQILFLLSRDFSRLVLVSFIIGVPLAYYMMQQWLHSFAYRISINWTIFLMTGIFLLCIAWLTVSYQSFKAARMNPALALRQE